MAARPHGCKAELRSVSREEEQTVQTVCRELRLTTPTSSSAPALSGSGGGDSTARPRKKGEVGERCI